MAIGHFRLALQVSVLTAFSNFAAQSNENAWVSPSELAQKVEGEFLSGTDDSSLGKHAAAKILEHSVDGQSLDKIFRSGWQAEEKLAETLLPPSAPWGSQLRFLQFIGNVERRVSRPWEETSLAQRETNLKNSLLSDYDMHTPPERTQVQLGLNVFKIFEVDLQTSVLTLAVWLRLSWKDPRLAFNSTKWNISSTTFGVEAHSFENTRIWVPDIEMYNNQGSVNDLANKNAQSYPDGSVFWSRSGLLHTLCVFEGLRSFPFDELQCQIEFGSWAFNDQRVDIIPRIVDGGATWTGRGGRGNGEVSARTQGTKFDDYTIREVKVERHVSYFDTSSGGWPVILFTITLQRATLFYLLTLVLPQCLCAILSWIAYFMHPEVGERFSFVITLFLASLTTDIVAIEFMPVCAEMLFMNWVSIGSQLSCILALLETSLVMFVYHLEILDLQQLLPCCCRCHHFRSDRATLCSMFSRVAKGESLSGVLPAMKRSGDRLQGMVYPSTPPENSAWTESQQNDGSSPAFRSEQDGIQKGQSMKTVKSTAKKKPAVSMMKELVEKEYASSPSQGHTSRLNKFDLRLRRHLYSQAFYVLDEDFSGFLEFNEIDIFGKFMLGDEWSQARLNSFMDHADRDHSGGLSLHEFSHFCEEAISGSDSGHDVADANYIQNMVDNFIEMVNRESEKTKARWKNSALMIDSFCRQAIPLCSSLIFFYISVAGT